MNEEGDDRGFRIVDRRRFTPDGQLRAGAEAEPPAPAPAAVRDTKEPAPPPPLASQPNPERPAPRPKHTGSIDFLTFVASLATNALAALGALPGDYGAITERNPQLAKEYIDILGMLQDKTHGNLTPGEAQNFERILADLRMAFLHYGKGGAPPPLKR